MAKRKKTTAQEAERRRDAAAVTPMGKAARREDKQWARKAGPVTTRQMTPEERERYGKR